MAGRVILHPTDFSAASRPAFARALELAKATGGQLLVLHVLNPMMPAIGARAVEPPTYARLQQVSRTEALKQLARLTARAKAARVPASAILLEGSEAGRITQLARSRRAWMIVMGTHGRTGVERVLLGSVAARVVSLAACPVMTVGPR